MTTGTTQLLEQPFALLRHGSAHSAAGQPVLIVRWFHHGDPSHHARMFGSTILGAEQMITAGFSGCEPHGVVMTGNHIVLDAESWDEKAVNHVFGRERDFEAPACRKVTLVNFALAAWILEVL